MAVSNSLWGLENARPFSRHISNSLRGARELGRIAQNDRALYEKLLEQLYNFNPTSQQWDPDQAKAANLRNRYVTEVKKAGTDAVKIRSAEDEFNRVARIVEEYRVGNLRGRGRGGGGAPGPAPTP